MAAERASAQEIAEISGLRRHEAGRRARRRPWWVTIRVSIQACCAFGGQPHDGADEGDYALLRTSFEVLTSLLDGPASSLPLYRAVFRRGDRAQV
jgi:hypothetical protein